MNRFSIASTFIAGIFGLGGLLTNDNLWSTGAASFVTQAEARIGRPLTPFSVAGVARRSTRRAVYGSYGYGYGSYSNPYYGYRSYGYGSPYYGYSSYSSGSPYYSDSSYSSGSPYYGYNYAYPYSYGFSRYPYYRTAYNWGRRWW